MNNLFNLLSRNENPEAIIEYYNENNFEQTILDKNLHLVEETSH